MAVAQTREDFLEAAGAYRRLELRGARGADLFYNHGTALLLAGRHAESARSLMRAERYDGAAPDIRRNLELALAGSDDPARGAQRFPWQRVPFFWHYGLSAPARAGIAAFAWLLLCAGLAWRVLAGPGRGRGVLWPALVLLLLFGSSAATSYWEESRDARQARSVAALPLRAAAPAAVPRPADDAAPAGAPKGAP
jgi:hypothetical protein